MNAHMVGVAAAMRQLSLAIWTFWKGDVNPQKTGERARGKQFSVNNSCSKAPHDVFLGDRDSREVGDGEKGVGVEDVGFEESLKQVPRHWLRKGASNNEEHLAAFPHLLGPETKKSNTRRISNSLRLVNRSVKPGGSGDGGRIASPRGGRLVRRAGTASYR